MWDHYQWRYLALKSKCHLPFPANGDDLSFTEMFVSNAWHILHEAPFPIQAHSVEGLTLRNEVYAFGRITVDIFWIIIYNNKVDLLDHGQIGKSQVPYTSLTRQLEGGVVQASWKLQDGFLQLTLSLIYGNIAQLLMYHWYPIVQYSGAEGLISIEI